MSTIMIAVDESKMANYAFETALHQVKPEDTIYLITVVIRPLLGSKHFKLSKATEENYNRIVADQKKEARKLLLAYRTRIQARGLKNFVLILSLGSHVGQSIVRAAELNNVQSLFIGSRGLGKLKRVLLGSVSKYVVEHAPCNVLVVKSEPEPSEVHEVPKEEVIKQEENERERRIQETESHYNFRSQLDKNIVILAEEEERWRRIHEEIERSRGSKKTMGSSKDWCGD